MNIFDNYYRDLRRQREQELLVEERVALKRGIRIALRRINPASALADELPGLSVQALHELDILVHGGRFS